MFSFFIPWLLFGWNPKLQSVKQKRDERKAKGLDNHKLENEL